MSDFLTRFSQFKKSLGLNNTIIAGKIGTSKQAIGEWGKSKMPSVNSLKKLNQAYKVNRDWLMDGNGEMLETADNDFISAMKKASPHLTPAARNQIRDLAEFLAAQK